MQADDGAHRQHAHRAPDERLDDLARPCDGRRLVTDVVHHDVLQAVLLDILLELGHDPVERLLARAHLRERVGLAVAHREHGRELDEVAQQRRRVADAPAPLQERERFGREQEAGGLDAAQRSRGASRQVLARVARGHRVEHRPRFVVAARRGIHDDVGEVDVARLHGSGGAHGALVGSRQLRRDEDAQHLVARARRLLEHGFQRVLGRLAGRGDVVHHVVDVGVERVQIHLRVRVFASLAVHEQGDHVDAGFARHVGGNGGDRIGEYLDHDILPRDMGAQAPSNKSRILVPYAMPRSFTTRSRRRSKRPYSRPTG